jgi:ABC-type branched-subunit amino acid transport system substrate-binding protein
MMPREDFMTQQNNDPPLKRVLGSPILNGISAVIGLVSAIFSENVALRITSIIFIFAVFVAYLIPNIPRIRSSTNNASFRVPYAFILAVITISMIILLGIFIKIDLRFKYLTVNSCDLTSIKGLPEPLLVDDATKDATEAVLKGDKSINQQIFDALKSGKKLSESEQKYLSDGKSNPNLSFLLLENDRENLLNQIPKPITPIEIGVIAPLGEDDYQPGLAMTQGILVAMRQQNREQNLTGRANFIARVYSEDILHPSQALKAYEKLRNYPVLGVIGPYASRSAKYILENGHGNQNFTGQDPVIVAGTTTSMDSRLSAADLFFRINPLVDTQGKMLAEEIKKDVGMFDKAMIFTTNEDPYLFSLSNYVSGCLSQLGIELVQENYRQGFIDEGIEKRINLVNPKTIFISAWPKDFISIVKKSGRGNSKGIYAGNSVYKNEVLSELGAKSIGLKLTSFGHIDENGVLRIFSRLFSTEFIKGNKKEHIPNDVSYQAYIATKFLLKAIVDSRVDDLSAKDKEIVSKRQDIYNSITNDKGSLVSEVKLDSSGNNSLAKPWVLLAVPCEEKAVFTVFKSEGFCK